MDWPQITVFHLKMLPICSGINFSKLVHVDFLTLLAIRLYINFERQFKRHISLPGYWLLHRGTPLSTNNTRYLQHWEATTVKPLAEGPGHCVSKDLYLSSYCGAQGVAWFQRSTIRIDGCVIMVFY